MTKWKSSKFKGVRFYEHPTRKHGVRSDRYFSIRYQKDGKRKEEGLGWGSDGWTESKSALELAALKEAAVRGEGHARLSDKRKAAFHKKTEQQDEEEKKKREAITFSAFFTSTYFPHTCQEKSPTSFKREESLFRLWIEPVIGHKTFWEISADIDLNRIIKRMRSAGRSPRTIHYMLAVVRQVFNYARRLEIFKGNNPVTKIKKPRYDNRRLRFLSHNEAGQLLNSLQTKSPQVYEMALVSLHCGLRAGEIFSLTWGDIDLVHGLINVRDTKSTKSRSLHMTRQVKELLRTKQQGNHAELVFPGRNGIRITAISNTFDRAAKDLGLNHNIDDRRLKVTFHTLRHSHASWLVMDGVDLYTVQHIMGHSSLAMTQRYAHLAPEKFKQATRVFENRLEQNKASSINGS